MYKGLKMIVAGMYAFSKEGLNDNIVSDETLKENISQTMHDVRAVLCYFSVSIWLLLTIWYSLYNLENQFGLQYSQYLFLFLMNLLHLINLVKTLK